MSRRQQQQQEKIGILVPFTASAGPPTDPRRREPEQIRGGKAERPAKLRGERPRRTESWLGKEMQPRVRAPATPRTAGPNSTDQTKNRAMVGGRKELCAWGPQVVPACELGFGSCGGQLRGGNRGGGRRREETGARARRGEERRILFYYFLFVVDVERRNKQSSRSGGRENI